MFLTGDLTLLHDLNAFALQGEMLLREAAGHSRPSIVIVLLDNNGGAIFDMLPQRSEDPYFERLFLTPQQVDFEKAAASFRRARSIGFKCRRVSWGSRRGLRYPGPFPYQGAACAFGGT